MACTIDNDPRGSRPNKPSYTMEDAVNADADADDELFEIDLKMLENIPPPKYYEAQFTAAGIALLANCLLPVDDISSAVPIQSFPKPTTRRSIHQPSELMLLRKCRERPQQVDWYVVGEPKVSPR